MDEIIKKPKKFNVEAEAKEETKQVNIIAEPKKQDMGLHNLKIPYGAHQRKRILGRGESSGHGKTSTRGSKGQTSRAGRDKYLGFEGGQTPLIRRIPKRGFTSQFKKEYQIVNLRDFNGIKEPTINLDILQQKGIIKDKNKLVKILGEGDIKEAKTIQAHAFSKSAQEKIKKSGGKIDIVKLVVRQARHTSNHTPTKSSDVPSAN